MSIREDWNKVLGVNPTWELQNDDWNEIRNHRLDIPYRGFVSAQTEIAQFLIDTKQLNLIGKATSIEELRELSGVQHIHKLQSGNNRIGTGDE